MNDLPDNLIIIPSLLNRERLRVFLNNMSLGLIPIDTIMLLIEKYLNRYVSYYLDKAVDGEWANDLKQDFSFYSGHYLKRPDLADAVDDFNCLIDSFVEYYIDLLLDIYTQEELINEEVVIHRAVLHGNTFSFTVGYCDGEAY